MTLSVLEIGLALVTAALGAGAGFWLRGWAWPAANSPVNELASDENKNKIDEEKAKEALVHLHDLTARVAADVGAHNTRVQEINDELTEGDNSAECVQQAMKQLLEANVKMQSQLEYAESRLHEQAKQLQSIEEQAMTDALTGIANRRAFDDFALRQQKEFNRDGRPATVLILDVDHFKRFNDTYGHAAGDEVLRGVANVLTDSMREIDLVARYGGEEFTVVFPGTKVAEAGPAAERARAAIESAVFTHGGIGLKVTASFGLAEIRSGEDMQQTVKRADDAMYASKKAGRNNTHWHDGEASHPLDVVALEEAKSKRKSKQPAVPQPAKAEPQVEVSPDPAPPPKTDLGICEETKLSNRAAFVEDVHRRISEWRRTREPLSVVLISIDELAALHGRFGNTGKHVAIKAATQFLKAAMRDMDHVARFDEETFALLLPGANLGSTELIAERLRHAIGKCALPLAGDQLRFTISLGVAEARTGDDAEKLLSRTASALSGAKASDGNQTFIHNGKTAEVTKKVVAGV